MTASAKVKDVTPLPKTSAKAAARSAEMADRDAFKAKANRPVAVAATPTPELGSTRSEIVKLAQAEKKILDAWSKDGENPPRPATPNLDSITNAATPHKGAAKPLVTRRQLHPRHAEANAARLAKGGKRGPGTPVTEEDLVAHLANVQRDHPDQTARGELEFMYWVLGWALSSSRVIKAWDAAKEADAAK